MNVEILDKISILSDDVLSEIMDEKDEIERSRTELECLSRAKELGKLTEFKKLLTAYKKKEKQYQIESEKKQTFDNYTDFHLPEKYENLYCGNWIANATGIKTFTMFGERLACYHPILPVLRLENVETGKEKIKLLFRKGMKWKEIVVDKSTIASNNKIISLADFGVSVTSETAKALVSYLSDVENFNVNTIPVQMSTSKLGWIGKEFIPYSNIIFDSENQFKSTFEVIKKHGNRDVWYNLLRKIRKAERFEPKIYVAGALASVLIEKVNALPFILNLWGDTGKGKTVALMLTASIWANPQRDYISDPKSTVTALEFRMNFLNHLPMLMDDTAQLKDKYSGDFSELIYFLCSGKGKDRANQNLGLNKATSWKNVILTNGEHSLVTETMQGGAINRVIDVEMQDGYIFENANKIVETIKENYGFLGFDFIQLVKEVGTEKIKEMQQDFLKKINDFTKQQGSEKEEKQTLPLSIILTADKLATDYLFRDNQFLDFKACVNLLKDKGTISENERAYEFLVCEIEMNINRFHPDQYGDYHGECWGSKDNGYAIIIKNIFNRIADKGNFNVKSFLKWAFKNNLIQSNKGRFDKLKKINGNPVRCIFLKLPEEEQSQKDELFP